MKRLIRGIALLISAAMLITLFSACSNKDKETYYEAQADEYDEERGLFDNIADTMLQAVTSGLGAGAKQVGTSVASWAAQGILNALGFDYGEDKTLTYVQECLKKLDDITGSIEDIQEQLNNIEKLSIDNKYIDVFSYYQKRYDELLSDTETAYKTFTELNRQSAEKPTTEILESLCADFAHLLDTRYTALESKVLQLGYALMGNTSESSVTTKYSIMDTMTYFAESETPFRNQRYAIENSVLVPSMTLYDFGHQMVLWDLSYELENFGVVELYVAADGSIIGFSHAASDGSSVKYQCSLDSISDYKVKYKEDLAALGLQDTPYADFTRTVGLKAYNLAVRYEQQEKQKLAIWKRYAAMPHEETSEENNVLETLNNAVMGTEVKTVTCAEFLSVSGGETTRRASDANFFDFQIDFDQLFTCTQKEFMAFVDAVKGFAGKRTFREFLTDNGFQFPSNNNADYWLLGIDTDGYEQRAALWGHAGWRSNDGKQKNLVKSHSFYTFSVKLDDKIADFAKKPNFVKIQYFSQVRYKHHSTSCGQYDYTTYENPIIVESSSIAYEPDDWTATSISSDGKKYAAGIVKYYTISGVGTDVNGLVHGNDVSQYWRK